MVGWLVGWLRKRSSYAVRSNPHGRKAAHGLVLSRNAPFSPIEFQGHHSVITSQVLKTGRGPPVRKLPEKGPTTGGGSSTHWRTTPRCSRTLGGDTDGVQVATAAMALYHEAGCLTSRRFQKAVPIHITEATTHQGLVCINPTCSRLCPWALVLDNGEDTSPAHPGGRGPALP